MLEFFARLEHILRRGYSLPSEPPYRPPSEDPSAAVDAEVLDLPGLVWLPLELLLQIIQYLTPGQQVWSP